MPSRSLRWTFEELGKGLNKSLEVEFECDVSFGLPGSYWEPPDPTEIEITDVFIISFRCNGGEIAVNPSLESTLKEVAFILADKYRQRLEETLLENMGDADYGDLDDYYERKRDERRGC